MVLPSEISIKQEKDDFEHDSAGYLSPEFEISVKVEVESSHVAQWEVKAEFTSEEEPENLGSDCENSDGGCSGVDYEDLIEYVRLKCDICNEEFCERYSLLRHNLAHLRLAIKPLHNILTKNKLSKYSTSTDAGNNNVSDNKNMNIKVSKTLHQCKICGKIQTYKTWHSHMKEVHGTDEFECSVCSAIFKCARYLRKHFYSIHLNRKFKGYSQTEGNVKCSLCPAVLRCKNALKTHMRNCHSEKAQCSICKSVLKSQAYLHAHMRRVHYNDGKEHKCYCGKKFPSPRYLKIHKKNTHLTM
ncbi:hypothetical protein ABMA27_012584 [Loxostege sticticalis]|uniref:C2H2-type domain-containing protein n=1 Tax=Loxostege sticticalis TaxID=481309 RepID=A0ABR3GZ47_LOXSC